MFNFPKKDKLFCERKEEDTDFTFSVILLISSIGGKQKKN